MVRTRARHGRMLIVGHGEGRGPRRSAASRQRRATTAVPSGHAHKHEPTSLVPAIPGAVMVIRKSTLNTVGLLDEGDFMHCEDLDWCKRCELAGIDIAYVSESSVVHAKGISSKSRPIGVLWNLHTGMIRFFNKHYRKQYGFFITGLTKLGIYVSFVMRVALGLLRSGLSKILTAAKSKSS